LITLARRWLDAGAITDRMQPDDVAALIQNAAFGLIVEQVITVRADIEPQLIASTSSSPLNDVTVTLRASRGRDCSGPGSRAADDPPGQ